MIRIVSRFLVPKGYSGISIGPLIIARDREHLDNRTFINHETIHFYQQLELLLIGFWLLYGGFYLYFRIRGKSHDAAYYAIPFEREAYNNQYNYQYLLDRRPYAWRKLVK